MPEIPQRMRVGIAVAAAMLLLGWRHMDHGPSPAAYSQTAPRSAVAAEPDASPVVVVDVTGAVKRPGVYRLSSGARVQDAVRRAGLRPNANVAGINLAARLADGEQVVVPGPGVAAVATAPGSPTAPVHLNSATLEQLQELDGIGPALAQRIIDFREQHGGFRSLDELDQVSGFGPARMASLRGHVAL
jgi:competence protein ComEA